MDVRARTAAGCDAVAVAVACCRNCRCGCHDVMISNSRRDVRPYGRFMTAATAIITVHYGQVGHAFCDGGVFSALTLAVVRVVGTLLLLLWLFFLRHRVVAGERTLAFLHA